MRTLLKRLAAGLAVLYGAASLAFLSLHLIPGDPVAILLGPATTASPEVRRQISAELGFDRPLLTQYLGHLGRLASGDLGSSYQLQRPVGWLIADQLGPTVQLAAAAIIVALALALISAVGTAGRHPAARALASAWELTAISLPSYWLGVLLLTAFSFHLRLFPIIGGAGPAISSRMNDDQIIMAALPEKYVARVESTSCL
ncbi:ABC transporter permease, partial [Nonomuraea sp. NPDC055795]